MNVTQTPRVRLGWRYWLPQVVPPMLVLLPLFGTRSGGALVFLAGFFLIPAFVSLVSIVLKFLAFRQRRHLLLRPSLTLAFFVAVLAVSELSYTVALDQATEAAEVLRQRCSESSSCPEAPPGWEVDGTRISRRDLGLWYTYIASYPYHPTGFDIRVYRGPDIGHMITGGVDAPVTVALYVED